jgi:hypothetical protein
MVAPLSAIGIFIAAFAIAALRDMHVGITIADALGDVHGRRARWSRPAWRFLEPSIRG